MQVVILAGVTALGEKFETYSPGDLGLMGDLLNNGVSVQATPPAKESFVKQLIISLAPILLLIGVIMYTMRVLVVLWAVKTQCHLVNQKRV